MKKLLSIVAMCLIPLSMMAQSQIATLTHEGTTKSYQGQNAFDYALRDATDGDLITLSAGTFVMEAQSGDFVINKGLTIRGNGMEGNESTIINNQLIIEKSENGTLGLKIEGVKFNGNVTTRGQSDRNTPYEIDGVTFVKCSMQNVTSQRTQPGSWNIECFGTFKNITFINCRCENEMKFYNESTVSFINCLLGKKVTTGASSYFPNNVSLIYDHCIHLVGGYPSEQTFTGVYRNSIICYDADTDTPVYLTIPSAVSFENCLISGYVKAPNTMFSICQYVNTEYRPMEDVFKTCTTKAGIADDTYELTDAAKSIFSTDGTTELGIYGGAAPFSSVVSYPRFTTFEVADKAVDGKLSVEIVVE